MSTPPIEPLPPVALEPLAYEAYSAAPAVLPAEFTEYPPEPRVTPGFIDLLVFLGILAAAFVVAIAAGAVGLAVWASVHKIAVTALTATKAQQMGLAVPFQVIFYALAVVLCVPAFRLRWHRPVHEGVHWNFANAASRAGFLMLGGVLLSLIVSVLSSKFIHTPDNAPMYELFRNARLAWTATIFGIFIAPPAEEFAFRGFLLPVLQRYTGRIVAITLTSVVFALMHASQIGHAWGAVAVLFVVSAVLCEVRLRMQSVAASTILHMSYNATLFLAMIWATGGYRHFDKIPH